jgi:hypothetical protein
MSPEGQVALNEQYPWVDKIRPTISLPINLEHTFSVMERSLNTFLENHAQTPVINSIGVYEPSVDKFLTYLPMKHLSKPKKEHLVCGGIIVGAPNTGRTTSLLRFVQGRGKSLVILPTSDRELLRYLGYNFSVSWDNEMVIMTPKMVKRHWHVLQNMEWHHIVMDQCYVGGSSWKTKCVWIVSNDMSQVNEWCEVFQLDAAFGITLDRYLMQHALGSYVVYLCGKRHQRHNWQLLPCHSVMKDDYPLSLVFRTVTPVAWLFALEYHEVDEYEFRKELNGITYEVQEEDTMETECMLCNEVSKDVVNNRVCEHWMCGPCMYKIAIKFGKCPFCTKSYDSDGYHGRMGPHIPTQPERHVTYDKTLLFSTIQGVVGPVVIVVDVQEVHELYIFMQYMLEGRKVVVNDIGDIMLITPRILRELRHALKPSLVICLTLSMDMLFTLEFYFQCTVSFVAPEQSLSSVLIQLHNHNKLFDINNHVLPSDIQLWKLFKHQF